MESKTNYTAVGIFVLGLSLLLVLTLWWLMNAGHHGETRPYLIYASDSVSGLKSSSDVLYRGVKIGQVSAIEIAPDNPALVRIQVDIDQRVVLRGDTVAELSPLGVTGLAVINLSGGRSSQPLLAAPGQSVAVIPYGASVVTRVEDNLTQATNHLARTLDQMDQLLSPRNVQAIGHSLDHLERVSAVIDRHSDDLGQALAGLRQSSQQLAAISASNGPLQRTLDDVDQAARGGSQAIGSLQQRTLPGLDRLTDHLQQLSGQLTELTRSLSRNPSQVIYGTPAALPGPGERP